MEKTSGFRAINDLPRAQWDETEFRQIFEYTYSTPSLQIIVR